LRENLLKPSGDFFLVMHGRLTEIASKLEFQSKWEGNAD